MSTYKLDLNKLRESDEKALEEVARYLLPGIERMVARFHPQADMSDVVQDVFVDILRNRKRLSEFETSEQVVAYCLRLARNAAVHHGRRPRWQVERAEYAEQESEISEEFDSESHEIDVSNRVQLEEALSRLSQEEQRLMFAYFFEGQTIAEIADSFGLTSATVRLQLKRTLNRLRYQLLRSGYGYKDNNSDLP